MPSAAIVRHLDIEVRQPRSVARMLRSGFFSQPFLILSSTAAASEVYDRAVDDGVVPIYVILGHRDVR